MYCIFVQYIPIFFMQTVHVSLAHTLAGHQNPIFALESGRDSAVLFTAGNDKGIVEWDLHTGKFKRVLCAVPASVYTLCLLADGNTLVAGLRNGEVWLIDVEKQALLKKLKVDQGAVFAIQEFVQKQELLAIGEEGVAYVWSLETLELLYRFKVSNTTVRCIACYPNQQQLLFGDKAGKLYQYDIAEFREINNQAIHSMPVTAILTTETHVFTGGRDAQLYKLAPQDLAVQKGITPHLFTVYGIVKHPEAELLTTVSRDKSIKFWDPQSLALLKTVSLDKGFDCHRLSINAAIYHPHSKQLITVADDKLVKVWDVALKPS